MGAWAGDRLQHFAPGIGSAMKIMGYGDYKVSKNILLDESNGPPEIVNRGKEFVVRHREYIMDIYSASGSANGVSPFNIQGFAINPGQFNTFPWISQIATKFEQYRIEGIIFEYKSMYSDAVVTQNGALGNVVLATEYNSGQPAFVNKQQMENYEFAQSVKPSCSVIHPIECARKQSVLSELYVRGGSVPSGEDVKTYDFGDFYIATVGVPLGGAGAAVNLGELWVSYQISFLKPKIATSGATYIDSGWFHWSNIAAMSVFQAGGSFPTSTGVPVTSSSSNLSCAISQTGNVGKITIPCLSTAMNYLITVNWNDVTAVQTGWTAPGLSVTGGSFMPATLNAGNAFVTPGASGAVDNGCSITFGLAVPAAQAVGQSAAVSFTGMAFPSTGSTDTVRCDILINAIPQNVN